MFISMIFIFFFFKQKTAYEMRISDWSSDVCSSDLLALRYNALVKQESLARFAQSLGLGDFIQLSRSERDSGGAGKPAILADACEAVVEIGRASCRARVCQYV